LLPVNADAPIAIQYMDSIDKAMTRMPMNKVTSLFVYKGNEFAGILTQSSVLQAANHKMSLRNVRNCTYKMHCNKNKFFARMSSIKV
jgi:signal-transduction protein with cAMP-binding, CBS, and nucleotidyltransferase domain